MSRVAVIGAGAFGTAMACVLRRSGHELVLWAREPEVAEAINGTRRNEHFLSGVELPDGIRATLDMEQAVAPVEFVLLAPPAQHMRSVTLELAPHLKPGVPVVSCSKGIERGTLALMPEVLEQTLPGRPVAVLSGPSFAREIASGLPCGVTLACAEPAVATRLAARIRNEAFGVHSTADVIGTAIGGVMKNVIAIASGVAAGRRLGENARATVITLGLAESVRLGMAKGARRETFDGFAGIGDMMLTANSLQSRNTSLGVALGEGKSAAAVLGARKEVTEGAHSAAAVVALAKQLDVRMPISEAVDAVLSHGGSVDEMVRRMMQA